MFRHNGGRASVSVKEYYRRTSFSIRVNYVLVCRLPGEIWLQLQLRVVDVMEIGIFKPNLDLIIENI